MRRSEAFLPVSREAEVEGSAAAELLSRAGLIRKFGSGLYGFAPAGERILRKLTRAVGAEMEAVGGQRVALPALQGAADWRASGRWKRFEGEMFALTDRDGRDLCLAPSHEEAAVRLVRGRVRSYDDLPLLLYQVGRKYRDDRARDGLVRCREFLMKDAYSFHADAESLAETYAEVRGAYERLLSALDVTFALVAADSGVMGGSTSEEFVAAVDGGSDDLAYCTGEDCRWGVTDEHPEFGAHSAGEDCPDCGADLAASGGVEVGHVFRLGTRYSEALDLAVDGPDGESRRVEMGSYGLGVSRLLQVLVAQHADADGCRWPATRRGTIAPYRAAVVPLRYEGDLRAVADRLHESLGPDDALLFDDRSQTIGERFAESDLLGIPVKVVLGNRFRETGDAELETRDGETTQVALDRVPEAVEELVE